MRGLPTSPFTAAGLLSSSSSSSSMSTPPLLAIASCSFASSTSFDVPKYLQRLNVERQEKHNYKIDYRPTCKSHSLLPSPWHQGSQSDQRFDRHRLPPPTSPTNNTWPVFQLIVNGQVSFKISVNFPAAQHDASSLPVCTSSTGFSVGSYSV